MSTKKHSDEGMIEYSCPDFTHDADIPQSYRPHRMLYRRSEETTTLHPPEDIEAEIKIPKQLLYQNSMGDWWKHPVVFVRWGSGNHVGEGTLFIMKADGTYSERRYSPLAWVVTAAEEEGCFGEIIPSMPPLNLDDIY